MEPYSRCCQGWSRTCAAAPGSAGVHPAAAPLLPSNGSADPATGAFAAAFHLSRADLDQATAKPPLLFGPCRVARLKVAVYASRRGATCGVSSGRLLGKVVIPLDLRAAEAKPVVFHSGWVAIRNRHRAAGRKAAPQAQLHLTVRVVGTRKRSCLIAPLHCSGNSTAANPMPTWWNIAYAWSGHRRLSRAGLPGIAKSCYGV